MSEPSTSKKASCAQTIELLMTCLDGELTAEQRAQFDAHVAICADCVNYIESYTQTLSLAKSAFSDAVADDTEFPTSLSEAILASRGRVQRE